MLGIFFILAISVLVVAYLYHIFHHRADGRRGSRESALNLSNVRLFHMDALHRLFTDPGAFDPLDSYS
jgi:hypothetical protein